MGMRFARLRNLFAFATIVWCSGLSAARAQSVGLGGYGAMGSSSLSGMGSSGPIIPYGGNLSGFMPFRMGAGGNGLSFSSRSSSQTWPARGAFRLSLMSKSTPISFGGARRSAAERARWNRVSQWGRWAVSASDGLAKPRRHAAELRLSVLSAAEPGIAGLVVFRHVIDVMNGTAIESLGFLAGVDCWGLCGAKRTVRARRGW